MTTFLDKLWSEYPLPKNLSIWGGDSPLAEPIDDINALIAAATDSVSSDILITGTVTCSGMFMRMPEGTITCNYAQLSETFPFQGNRNVKVTYSKPTNTAYVRYFPADITYQRRLTVNDLNDLHGNQFNYVKCYCLIKMLDKEITILKSVNATLDNAAFDVSTLVEFRTSLQTQFADLRNDILLYSTVY